MGSRTFWKQPWFQGNTWIFPWFQVNLKSTLIKKKTVLTHFQNSLDFKATWIFDRFTMSHSRVLAYFVSHKGYAKSTQLNLSVATDKFFILFLTRQKQVEENKWKWFWRIRNILREANLKKILTWQKQENKFEKK